MPATRVPRPSSPVSCHATAPEEAAAIEREDGHQVHQPDEEAQQPDHRERLRERLGGDAGHGRRADRAGRAEGDGADRDARQRPRDRDRGLPPGRPRATLRRRDPAEEQERHRRRRGAAATPDREVGHLVEQHRDEEAGPAPMATAQATPDGQSGNWPGQLDSAERCHEEGHDQGPREVHADLRAEEARHRDPAEQHLRPARRGLTTGERPGRGGEERGPTTAMATLVSVQKSSGKSWTRRSVAGSKLHVPAAKNRSWKSVNAWSKASAKATPTTTAPTARIAAPRATARQYQAAPRATSTADGEHGKRREDQREERDDDPVHVGHVGALARVEDRQCHRRSGRTCPDPGRPRRGPSR